MPRTQEGPFHPGSHGESSAGHELGNSAVHKVLQQLIIDCPVMSIQIHITDDLSLKVL